MMETPCRFCVDRHMKCHATCDSYKQWKQLVQETNDNIRKKRQSDWQIDEFKKDVMLKLKYRRKK